MMSIKNTLLISVSLFGYLFTLMGVGKYSCHCDHASQIALLGIHTNCSCTQEQHYEHKDHKCICGAHLEAEVPKRDDCCAVSYYFLDSDQDYSIGIFNFVQSDITLLLIQSHLCPGITMIRKPLIKSFQALFRSSPVHIFKLNRQLIL
ncbi:MAG: hypothetical protein Q8R90_02755 [Bacteroidales bacterium]|nr:hypothetical protein [Bacteroidales bacterium]